jgi:hypothetical protein
MKITRLDSMLMLAIVVAASSVGCTTASPTIQTGPDAAVSFDGLHEIDNSRADIAWARPDIDFSNYTSILPVSLGIEYTEVANKANTAVTRTQRGPYFIDDKARAEFEALVGEIFMEELQKNDRFRIVDERGPNTLIVAGGLLDVTSQVPRHGLAVVRAFISAQSETRPWFWRFGTPRPTGFSHALLIDALPSQLVPASKHRILSRIPQKSGA